jgi:putative PIN family toxin of toxin-antitoxin system
MKVVIDTNVVVSANLSDQGPSAAILDLAANRVILMCISPAVLAEYKPCSAGRVSSSIPPALQDPWPSFATLAAWSIPLAA